MGPASKFLIKGGLLALALAASLCAIVFGIPDETDILEVSRIKNERLAHVAGPKIVLIGGSNLAYGADSAMIERATGCAVVDMGLNGFLGAHYLFSEVRPHLEAGDIAVIAFEYDTYAAPVTGRPDALFGVAKADMHALSRMTLEQQISVVQTMPNIAQRKVLRVMGQTEGRIVNALAGHEERPPYYPTSDEEAMVAEVERLSSFNRYGDIVGHLGRRQPFRPFDGLDLEQLGVNPEAVAETIAFAREMKERGVTVLVSFTPTARDYYEANAHAIQALRDDLDAALPGMVLSGPDNFLYDRSQFFDTVYHLQAEPRADRSRKLTADIVAVQGESGACRGETHAAR